MRKKTYVGKFKKGDLIRAQLPGVPLEHICIILEDEPINRHIKCLAICNLTSSKAPEGEYSIDVSKYSLPENWFDNKKTTSWIRCNEVDCIYCYNLSSEKRLGNILELYPDLWSEVCKAAHNCPISTKLESICDCDFKKLEFLISNGKIKPNDCGCK